MSSPYSLFNHFFSNKATACAFGSASFTTKFTSCFFGPCAGTLRTRTELNAVSNKNGKKKVQQEGIQTCFHSRGYRHLTSTLRGQVRPSKRSLNLDVKHCLCCTRARQSSACGAHRRSIEGGERHQKTQRHPAITSRNPGRPTQPWVANRHGPILNLDFKLLASVCKFKEITVYW